MLALDVQNMLNMLAASNPMAYGFAKSSATIPEICVAPF